MLFVFTFVRMADPVKDINAVLQQYFDKVLVLTVPRFTDRQERIKQRLQGIGFEFFYGVDKNDLTDELIREQYNYDKKNSLAISQQFKALNSGEIACALSHRNIYKAIADHQWKRVLILEDDIIPEWNKLPDLFTAVKELPHDWELFYLGYLKNEKATLARRLKQYWYIIQAGLGLTRMPAAMIKNRLPRPFSACLFKAGFHDCTHAYAVSHAGALKLLQAQTPVQYRADNLLSALVLKKQISAFISKRQLFSQEIFVQSDTESYVREKQKLSVR